MLDVNVGSVLLVHGNWKVDTKYGKQFMAETWEETLPTTVYGMEKYLGSGLIKGVEPKFAQRIVIPIRLRFTNNDGERNEYTIRGYKDLSGQESLCSTYF